MPGVTCTLMARAQIVSQITTVKNCVRGILKTFGHVLPKKLRATYIAPIRSARGACFLKAAAMASGVDATLPRQTKLSVSSITAIDVSSSDTSRPTYCFSLGIRHVPPAGVGKEHLQ